MPHPSSIDAHGVVVFLAQPDGLVADPASRAILAADDVAESPAFASSATVTPPSRHAPLQAPRPVVCAQVGARPLGASSPTTDGPPANRRPSTRSCHWRLSVAYMRGLVAGAGSACHARSASTSIRGATMSPGHRHPTPSFAPAERAARRPADGAQPRRFVELWVPREAYIKARGLGLALDLERIS